MAFHDEKKKAIRILRGRNHEEGTVAISLKKA